MADFEETSSPDARCVLVDTNLETHLATVVHKDEAVSEFKAKFCKEHKECFPQFGDIIITALKVKHRGSFFHFSNSMVMSKLFYSTSGRWSMNVDVVRVDKTTIDTNDLTSGEAQVAKKKSRKMKSKSSDAEESQKKPAIDLNQSKETIDEVKDQTPEEALVTEVTMGISNQSRNSCEKVPREELDHLTGGIEQDLEKGEKTAEIDQDKDVAPTLELVDGHTTSRDDVNESHVCEKGKAAEHCVILPREKQDDFLSGAIERDNKRGEESRLAPSAADNLQTAELVTFTDNQLEASSGLTTGQATEKRRKRKKRSTDHISQSTAAVTRDTVNEINGVDATCESGLVEALVNPLVEAIQKENDELGKDKTDNEASYPANRLEANSGLTTGTARERKKRRKKSSKDDTNQLTATTSTSPKHIANEINGVPADVDCVAATCETCPISGRGNLGDPLAAVHKENEMGDEVVGSGKAIPSASDIIIQTDDNSAKENQLVPSSDLTTGPATEKKRRRKKSSKGHSKQSCVGATTTEPFPNSRGEKLADDTLVEAIRKENDNSADNNKVESKEESVNNLQAGDLVSTPHALVLDNIEVGKDIEAKSAKKRKSRKEASLVAPVAENVEVVDGEGSDKVIRNVLDSLQENEENVEKSGNKSSKRLKKGSLNVEVVLALPAINKRKASLTPDTERDAKETSIEEDEKEKAADMGDKFEEDGKKQEEVSGGAKSKKPKERKSRAKAASGELQSRVNKDDGIESKVDHSSSKKKKINFLNFFKGGEKRDSTEDEAESTEKSSSDDDREAEYTEKLNKLQEGETVSFPVSTRRRETCFRLCPR